MLLNEVIGLKMIPRDWEVQKTTLINGGHGTHYHNKTPLLITAAEPKDLGKGCENVPMVQFDNNPEWYILAHYKKYNG
jgi:hypothetical protein